MHDRVMTREPDNRFTDGDVNLMVFFLFNIVANLGFSLSFKLWCSASIWSGNCGGFPYHQCHKHLNSTYKRTHPQKENKASCKHVIKTVMHASKASCKHVIKLQTIPSLVDQYWYGPVPCQCLTHSSISGTATEAKRSDALLQTLSLFSCGGNRTE